MKDLCDCLETYGCIVTIVDPWVNSDSIESDSVNLIPTLRINSDTAGAAVAHNEFQGISIDEWKNLVIQDGVFLILKI